MILQTQNFTLHIQNNTFTQGAGGRALYLIRTPYGGGEVYERLRDIYDYFNHR